MTNPFAYTTIQGCEIRLFQKPSYLGELHHPCSQRPAYEAPHHRTNTSTSPQSLALRISPSYSVLIRIPRMEYVAVLCNRRGVSGPQQSLNLSQHTLSQNAGAVQSPSCENNLSRRRYNRVWRSNRPLLCDFRIVLKALTSSSLDGGRFASPRGH